MMERNKTGRDPSDPLVWDTEELASATECTGLVPSAIQTPEEAEDYSRLYAIHQQKTAWKPDAAEVWKGKEKGVP